MCYWKINVEKSHILISSGEYYWDNLSKKWVFDAHLSLNIQKIIYNSVFLFIKIKDGYIISEESTKERDHYSGDQQMLNEHVISSYILYIYCFVLAIVDPEAQTKMDYWKYLFLLYTER